MDTTLYIAMTGAKRSLNEQGVYGNNLANTNTPGFRQDLYLSQSWYQTGYPPDAEVYTGSNRSGIDFEAGPIVSTGRDLDVAINGEGWFVVQNNAGALALSRAGNFQVNSTGLLTTADGLIVRGSGGPITIPPNSKVQVGTDGTISVVPQGEGPEAATVLDRFLLVNPNKNTLTKGADGLIHFGGNQIPQADANISVTSQALEGSNVNAVDQMVQMIGAQRDFEVQLKLMQNVNSNQQTLARLLQL